MNPLHTTAKAALRAAFAVLIALAAIVATATPAGAAPGDYFVSTVGEDGCTVFETTGNADLSYPGMPVVILEGRADRYDDGGDCLDVEPFDRRIEFVALDGSGMVVGDAYVPLPLANGSEEYTAAIYGLYGSDVVVVIVDICVVGGDPGSFICGESDIIVPA
ncbi:hypothetical protein GCM10009830_16100 [Glycomyces endophyticus]|uniref:Secreted protein n=1 Tax=Glycomyces endophyticus TaxID=480996 RepID=A0ABN2GGL5_9ACTN